jgi:hypothetical protein
MQLHQYFGSGNEQYAMRHQQQEQYSEDEHDLPVQEQHLHIVRALFDWQYGWKGSFRLCKRQQQFHHMRILSRE